MKLFGWGKSKDSPPQARQQLSKPDPKSGSHGLDRGMRSVLLSKASVRKRRGLFESDSEEKAQDNIQFVFSHEQEGLLAIGTFALEQLQSVRDTSDEHHRGADPGDDEFGFGLGVSVLTLDNDVIHSSDDEDQLQRGWLAARKNCELPFVGGESDLEQEPTSHLESVATQPQIGVQQPWHKESKALTLFKANPNLNPVVDETPVFILAPELQSSLHRPFLPHWTDSIPPPVTANVEKGLFVGDDHYSTRLCGLFSKKKSLKPDKASKSGLKYNLMAIVPADGEDGKRIAPIEQTKRSVATFAGVSMPSLGKLAKLWRASCTPSGSARIASQRKPSPLLGSKADSGSTVRLQGRRGQKKSAKAWVDDGPPRRN